MAAEPIFDELKVRITSRRKFLKFTEFSRILEMILVGQIPFPQFFAALSEIYIGIYLLWKKFTLELN